MKTFLVVALVCVPVLAWAEPVATTSTAPSTKPNTQLPQPTEELKVMTERIGLSKEQQDKIAPMLVAELKQRQAIEANKSLSPMQKQVQSGVVHRATLQQIKAVFTPAQQAAIEQGQDHPATSSTNP